VLFHCAECNTPRGCRLQDEVNQVPSLPGGGAGRKLEPLLKLGQKNGRVGVGERKPAAGHGIEHNAHAPHVGETAVVGFALDDFGRGVGIRAAVCRQLPRVLVCEQGGKSEIGNFYVALGVEQNVFALEVAVHDLLRVAVFHAQHYLAKQAPGRVVRECAAAIDVFQQVATLGVFHNKIRLGGGLAAVKQLYLDTGNVPCEQQELVGTRAMTQWGPYNVGVAKGLHSFDLARVKLSQIPVGSLGFGNNLDSDLCPENEEDNQIRTATARQTNPNVPCDASGRNVQS
jgi:hypothetical protein